MRMHGGFPDCAATGGSARVVDWISVPLGVATLDHSGDDVGIQQTVQPG